MQTMPRALAGLLASVALFRVGGPLPDALPIDDPRVDGPFGVKGVVARLINSEACPLILPYHAALDQAREHS